MLSWIGPWLLFLFAGIVVLLPLYAKLINKLKELNPVEYERIGSPTLFMVNPARGIKLQRFIYRGSKDKEIAPEITRLCGVVGLLTPVFVVLVFAGLILGFWLTVGAIQ